MHFLFVLALLLVAPPVHAETPVERYTRCMDQARSDPAAALATARAWKGRAAEHCEAVALMGLKRYGEATARFRHLAAAADPVLRVDLLAQAGQALLLDNQPEEAEAVLSEALTLRPSDADLLTDRGVARAEQFRYVDAVRDFSAAIEQAPDAADAFLFRAAALRKLDKLPRAMKDVETALRLRPRSPDALLERGILKRLTGDRYGARADWLAVLKDWPDTAAAEAAAVNIDILNNPPELQPGEQPGTPTNDPAAPE